MSRKHIKSFASGIAHMFAFYVTKGLLPYHGLGSGIKRALEQWPAIDFIDNHDGCLFTATIHRKPVEELEVVTVVALNV